MDHDKRLDEIHLRPKGRSLLSLGDKSMLPQTFQIKE